MDPSENDKDPFDYFDYLALFYGIIIAGTMALLLLFAVKKLIYTNF